MVQTEEPRIPRILSPGAGTGGVDIAEGTKADPGTGTRMLTCLRGIALGQVDVALWT